MRIVPRGNAHRVGEQGLKPVAEARGAVEDDALAAQVHQQARVLPVAPHLRPAAPFIPGPRCWAGCGNLS